MEDFENFERTQSFAQIKLLWNRTLCSRHCLALWVQRVTTRSPRLERTAVSGRNVSVTGHFCTFWWRFFGRRRAWDLWLQRLRCFIPRVQVICLQRLPIRTATVVWLLPSFNPAGGFPGVGVWPARTTWKQICYGWEMNLLIWKWTELRISNIRFASICHEIGMQIYFFRGEQIGASCPTSVSFTNAFAALPNLSICESPNMILGRFTVSILEPKKGRFGQRELQEVDWKFGSCLDRSSPKINLFWAFPSFATVSPNSAKHRQKAFCSPKVSSLQCP